MTKQKNIPPQVDAVVIEQMRDLLESVVRVLIYQNKPSIANQGQALDGYMALANYNGIAEKIQKFLKKYPYNKGLNGGG